MVRVYAIDYVRKQSMKKASSSPLFGRAMMSGILLLTVHGGAFAAAQESQDMPDCRSLRDDAARLACYDRQNAVPEARNTPEAAEEARPAPNDGPDTVPLDEAIGQEALERGDRSDGGPAVRGRMVSCHEELNGQFVFFFDNGQVWRQKDDVRLRWNGCSFDVTITKDFFGYQVLPDGETQKVRISRVK